jgi:hypothetical protein
MCPWGLSVCRAQSPQGVAAIGYEGCGEAGCEANSGNDNTALGMPLQQRAVRRR